MQILLYLQNVSEEYQKKYLAVMEAPPIHLFSPSASEHFQERLVMHYEDM